MTSESARRFTLLDASVLIAATAVGLATGRAADWAAASQGDVFSSRGDAFPPRSWVDLAVSALGWLRVAWILLIAWVPAVLALGVLSPGGRRGRAGQGPGMAACGALTAALILQAIPYLILAGTFWAKMAKIDGDIPPAHYWTVVWRFVTSTAEIKGYLPPVKDWINIYNAQAACAVAGSWVALLLAGRWQPDRGWLDRVGRLLGLAWVATHALSQTLLILMATLN